MVGTVPPIELVWELYLVATIALMAFNLIKHQPPGTGINETAP